MAREATACLGRPDLLEHMLSCGHENPPFGFPLCTHLRTCRLPWLEYVKWYVGCGLRADLICVPCAEAREKGLTAEAEYVCEECYEYATREVGDLIKAGGQPEIRVSSSEFEVVLKRSEIPPACGNIVDIASFDREGRSLWLMLAEDGKIFRFDADDEKAEFAGASDLPVEVRGEPFRGFARRQHLHSSREGEFAAVVNDYGRYGQVIDLGSGRVTLNLDGGQYHSETVPFSFAFAYLQGRVVAIHRTDWNRLDISDASNGRLLTDRGPTDYRQGQRPPHYLDYFHGALYLSPGGTHIIDDGWIWHPLGIPVVWSVDSWLSKNAWESEDGATRREICAREYYWDHGIAWLDEATVAIGGIGDDDTEMIDGARIFDITSTGRAGSRWRSDWLWAREIRKFAGPTDKFFSDGKWLYSSAQAGLSRWDLETGTRTGHIEGFCPSYYHPGTGELAQLLGGSLLRWSAKHEASNVRSRLSR